MPLGFSLVRQGTDEDEVDNRKHRDEVHDGGADLRADQVASWIAAGTPPIYFGFGSFPVESAAGTPGGRAPRWRGQRGRGSARRGPTLILSTWWGDQRLSGGVVKRLKVGTPPQYVTRAGEVATRMTKHAASVAAAAGLLENFARQRCFADR